MNVKQDMYADNLVVKTQEIKETQDGYAVTVICDDGVSILENLGITISTTSGHVFHIDLEDYPRVSEFKWWVSSDGNGRMYAHTKIGGKKTLSTQVHIEGTRRAQRGPSQR